MGSQRIGHDQETSTLFVLLNPCFLVVRLNPCFLLHLKIQKELNLHPNWILLLPDSMVLLDNFASGFRHKNTLVHWEDLEGSGGEGGGREDRDGEHM